MQLGANVILSTGRSPAATSTGQASPAVAYLSGVTAYMRIMPATEYAKLPPDMLDLQNLYEIRVDATVDIQPGDRLTSITQLDGVTPWPPTLTGASYSWVVRYVRPSSPVLLSSRRCYVQYQQVAR